FPITKLLSKSRHVIASASAMTPPSGRRRTLELGDEAPEGADVSSRELRSRQDPGLGPDWRCTLWSEEADEYPEELPELPPDKCPGELWGLLVAKYPEEMENLWTAGPYTQTVVGVALGNKTLV
ncbi:hypothetical protein KIL84_010290, partial [Mauremys mutica]